MFSIVILIWLAWKLCSLLPSCCCWQRGANLLDIQYSMHRSSVSYNVWTCKTGEQIETWHSNWIWDAKNCLCSNLSQTECCLGHMMSHHASPSPCNTIMRFPKLTKLQRPHPHILNLIWHPQHIASTRTTCDHTLIAPNALAPGPWSVHTSPNACHMMVHHTTGLSHPWGPAKLCLLLVSHRHSTSTTWSWS